MVSFHAVLVTNEVGAVLGAMIRLDSTSALAALDEER